MEAPLRIGPRESKWETLILEFCTCEMKRVARMRKAWMIVRREGMACMNDCKDGRKGLLG